MKAFCSDENFENISDISVSEIGEKDLEKLDKDGYSFHPSKYNFTFTKLKPPNSQALIKEDEILQNTFNSPTFNIGSADLNQLELDVERDPDGDKNLDHLFGARAVESKLRFGHQQNDFALTGPALNSTLKSTPKNYCKEATERGMNNNVDKFAAILSPPLSSQPVEKEVNDFGKLQQECVNLKEMNQKLTEAIQENNKVIENLRNKAISAKYPEKKDFSLNLGDGSNFKNEVFSTQKQVEGNLRVEISKLNAKIANLEYENDQLKQYANNTPQSPLAEYSIRKSNESKQEIQHLVQLEFEAKFLEYKEMLTAEYAQRMENAEEGFEKKMTSLKSSHQSELGKLKYQLEQARLEITQNEKTIQNIREESANVIQKTIKENDAKIAQLTAMHEKSANEFIERVTREKEEEILSLKSKYKQDLASLSDKFKQQLNQAISKIKDDFSGKQKELMKLHQNEVDQLKQQLVEKESFFVNALMPPELNSNSISMKELQQKNDELIKENSLLKLYRQKLIDKVKRKFREHLLLLKQTFQVQKEKMKIEFERKLAQKIDHLYCKYKMR